MFEDYDAYAQELWQVFKKKNLKPILTETNVKINWKHKLLPQVQYYSDLSLNEAFRLTTGQAIYIKVLVSPKVAGNRNEEYGMLEIATGKVFPPSNSPVELVNVEVNVDSVKPPLY